MPEGSTPHATPLLSVLPVNVALGLTLAVTGTFALALDWFGCGPWRQFEPKWINSPGAYTLLFSTGVLAVVDVAGYSGIAPNVIAGGTGICVVALAVDGRQLRGGPGYVATLLGGMLLLVYAIGHKLLPALRRVILGMGFVLGGLGWGLWWGELHPSFSEVRVVTLRGLTVLTGNSAIENLMYSHFAMALVYIVCVKVPYTVHRVKLLLLAFVSTSNIGVVVLAVPRSPDLVCFSVHPGVYVVVVTNMALAAFSLALLVSQPTQPIHEPDRQGDTIQELDRNSTQQHQPQQDQRDQHSAPSSNGSVYEPLSFSVHS